MQTQNSPLAERGVESDKNQCDHCPAASQVNTACKSHIWKMQETPTARAVLQEDPKNVALAKLCPKDRSAEGAKACGKQRMATLYI